MLRWCSLFLCVVMLSCTGCRLIGRVLDITLRTAVQLLPLLLFVSVDEDGDGYREMNVAGVLRDGQELIGTYVAANQLEPLNFLYEQNGWLDVMPETLIQLLDGRVMPVPAQHQADQQLARDQVVARTLQMLLQQCLRRGQIAARDRHDRFVRDPQPKYPGDRCNASQRLSGPASMRHLAIFQIVWIK